MHLFYTEDFNAIKSMFLIEKIKMNLIIDLPIGWEGALQPHLVWFLNWKSYWSGLNLFMCLKLLSLCRI